MDPPSYDEAIRQPSPIPSAPPSSDGFMGYSSGSNKYLNLPKIYPYPGSSSKPKINSSPVPERFPQNPGPTTQFLDGSSQQQEREEDKFGSRPQRAYCSNCRQYVRTLIESGTNAQCELTTAICCCLGALACGFCFLAAIPATFLATRKHICPICNLKLGEHVPQC